MKVRLQQNKYRKTLDLFAFIKCNTKRLNLINLLSLKNLTELVTFY